MSDAAEAPEHRTHGPSRESAAAVDGVIATLLAETVAAHLAVRPDDLAGQLHLADDLGVDSLAVLDLGMRLEDVFDVWLTDEQLSALVTFADLEAAVREAVSRRDA